MDLRQSMAAEVDELGLRVPEADPIVRSELSDR
jgi:hypothetical protein